MNIVSRCKPKALRLGREDAYQFVRFSFVQQYAFVFGRSKPLPYRVCAFFGCAAVCVCCGRAMRAPTMWELRGTPAAGGGLIRLLVPPTGRGRLRSLPQRGRLIYLEIVFEAFRLRKTGLGRSEA